LPPPLGGVASIVKILHDGLSKDKRVIFVSPMNLSSPYGVVKFRFLFNFFRLVSAIFLIKSGGKVLLFSSAYKSFYEKILWALVIIFFRRKPVLVMVDGGFPYFWSRMIPPIRIIISLIICNKNFQLIAQSASWRQYYKGLFPGANISVVNATCSGGFILDPENPYSSKSSINLLYVGWVIPEKGILDLLDAIKILLEDSKPLRLRIIGPLFDRASFWKEQALKRGVSDYVTFAGSVHGSENIIRELDLASIFVFPSHFEGFPVALLEAIARGLPCIGTRVGGIPDVLDDGRAGLLVDPKNPQQIASAIELLMTNKDLVSDLSFRAFSRSRTEYSFAECIKSYKRVLELIDTYGD
jgi:glycosyltransferase involved in cell wall biosynthesis